jgi:hypothetical protein
MKKRKLNEALKRYNRCRNCICLVAGVNGKPICDEVGKACIEVKICPEQGD